MSSIAQNEGNLVDHLVHPPLLMGLLSLLPFGIYFSDTLSAKALNLSRYVGFSWEAVLFALLCVVAFAMAFYVVRDRCLDPSFPDPPTVGRDPFKFFLLACWALMLLGLGVTLLTIFAEGPEYIIKLWGTVMAGESAEAILYSPQGVMYSQNMPGVVRMLGACSNSAVLVWLAARPLMVGRARKPWYANLFAFLLLNFLRSMLAGDRAPAMAAFELTAYVLVRDFWEVLRRGEDRKMLLARLPLFAGVVGAGLAGYWVLGILRGAKASEYSTTLLYADLGMANLALAIRTGFNHAFGINSILGPVPNIVRTFGVIVDWPVFHTDYIWSPPGNFLMLSYYDFGWFGWLNYIVMGAVAGMIWSRPCWTPAALKWRLARYYCIYVITSIFAAGIISGVDFWAGASGSAVVLWLWARGRGDGIAVQSQG